MPKLSNFSVDAAIVHLGTHWQTSIVGVSLLVLAAAAQLGIHLPLVGGVELSASELATAGVSALGFLASKDANKA